MIDPSWWAYKYVARDLAYGLPWAASFVDLEKFGKLFVAMVG